MFSKLILALFVVCSFQLVKAQNLKMFVTLNPAGDFVAENEKIDGKVYENADGSVEASNIKLAVKEFKTGITLRDNHMVEKYLEASKYPEILLKIAKGKNGKGEAIITVKGKSAKVSGSYMKGKDKLKALFNAKISDFGIADINYKGIGVEDEVKIEVILPLEKKTGGAAPA
jgi:polyisoprenoid-binding protein YceI